MAVLNGLVGGGGGGRVRISEFDTFNELVSSLLIIVL